MIKLIVNPKAGSSGGKNIIAAFRSFFGSALIEACVPESREATLTEAREAASFPGRYEFLASAGGDGTLNNCIEGVLQAGTRLPIAFVPAGTVNVMAVELGLSKNLEERLRAIKAMKIKSIDIGFIENPERKYFSLMCGLGFDAGIVRDVSHSLKRKIGPLAYLKKGLDEITGFSPPLIEAEFDGAPCREKFYSAILCNSSHYGGPFHAVKNASIDDGRLDILLMKYRSGLRYLKLGFDVTTGRGPDKNTHTVVRAEKAFFKSAGEVPCHIDSEYAGSLPLKAGVLKKAIDMVL